MSNLLAKLGLHRPELRAWAMYDWANSAFITVIITAVYPVYFSKIAGADVPPEVSELRHGIATTLGLLIIAALAPILGAIADFAPIKKRMIGTFLGIGVVSVALMFFIQRGDWLLACVLFVIANFAANGSFVFYDALLPHIAKEEEMDRVSTAGYAIGYVGGGLLLALNLAWILKPQWFGLPHGQGLTAAQETLPTRLAFLSVALWWLLFAIPLFRRVPEPALNIRAGQLTSGGAVRNGFRQLGETFQELRRFKNALLMLIGFLIYNDGIGTIIRMAVIYGQGKGIGQDALISAILITQFVGIPFAFLFGLLAGKIGAKPAIFLALAVYGGISIFGYFMETATHFFILAILVGMVQGGAQALSRSLFASMIPRHKSGQFFGFFAVVEKFAGIFGPFLFSAMIAATGSSRNAILSVIAFFVVGGAVFYFVNVDEGQRLAREAEAETQPRAKLNSEQGGDQQLTPDKT
ncbi:MAG: MFS transporter [Verrucomicrobia bacterium]|nr:MFS transporter [Verrucomicrobiota bacterium]